MPAVQGLIQPLRNVLNLDRQPTVGLGCAHQLLQGFLTQFDLILKHAQIVLQIRVKVIATHLLEQHAHGRQRRPQFMGCTGRLRGHGQQLLVAQAFFTAQGAQFFLTAQFLTHFGGKERDHRS